MKEFTHMMLLQDAGRSEQILVRLPKWDDDSAKVLVECYNRANGSEHRIVLHAPCTEITAEGIPEIEIREMLDICEEDSGREGQPMMYVYAVTRMSRYWLGGEEA